MGLRYVNSMVFTEDLCFLSGMTTVFASKDLTGMFMCVYFSFLPKYRVIYYDYIVKWCKLDIM